VSPNTSSPCWITGPCLQPDAHSRACSRRRPAARRRRRASRRRGDRRVRAREKGHHLVADGLHHPPARRLQRLAASTSRQPEIAPCAVVSRPLRKLGAAAYGRRKRTVLWRESSIPCPDCRSKMGKIGVRPRFFLVQSCGSDPIFQCRETPPQRLRDELDPAIFKIARFRNANPTATLSSPPG